MHRSIFILEDLLPSNIHQRITAVYGAQCFIMYDVFPMGLYNRQLNIEDRRRNVRPISATDEKTIKIWSLNTVKLLSEIRGISTWHHSYDHLHMSKILASTFANASERVKEFLAHL